MRLHQSDRQNQSETKSTDADEACPECGANLVNDRQHGEKRCTDCGLVTDDSGITEPKRRRITSDEDYRNKRQTGPATERKYHDKRLKTRIGKNRDGNGNLLDDSTKTKLARLRKKQEQTKDAGYNPIREGLSEINRLCAALGLPDQVTEMAAMIYRRAVDENLIVGRTIEGMAGGSLYLAARKANLARTFEEIEAVSRVPSQKIRKGQSLIRQEVGIEVNPADPKQYVPRFASELSVPAIVESEAKAILDRVNKAKLSGQGRQPPNVAAAALYAASLYHSTGLTRGEIADKAQVSRPQLSENAKILIDDDKQISLNRDDVSHLNAVDVASAFTDRKRI